MAKKSDPVLQQILKEMQSEMGNRIDCSIMGERKFSAEVTDWLPTGLTLLTGAIGGEGLPMGRMIEVSGLESTGKSALCAYFIGQAQKHRNAIVALMDTEAAYTTEFVFKVGGADPDDIYYLDPTTLEDCWDGLTKFIETARAHDEERPILIIVDSVAGLPTQEEDEASFEDKVSISKAARVNKLAMRKLRKLISKTNTTVVLTNQLIAVPNAPAWGEKYTTSGGGGPKYFSSVRLRLERVQKMKNAAGQLIGLMIRMGVYKNRMDQEGRKIDIPFYFKGGFDDVESVLTFLKARNQLGSTKGWATVNGEKYRLSQLVEKCRQDPPLYATLQQQAIQLLKTGALSQEEEAEEGIVEGAA